MNKAKILVVDDEKFFRELYADILANEGFIVTSADGGAKALEAVKSERFDVVITDMLMPDWDGIRTIEEIRKVEPGQDIIIVTQVSELETAVEAMKSGAADYILKPINGSELVYALRKLLKRQKVLARHSKLIQESVEYFEILSIYKTCLRILSVNEFSVLIDHLTDVMIAETGAKKGFFWFSRDGVDGDWSIISSTVEEDNVSRKVLKRDKDIWKNGVEAGLPFYQNEETKDLLFIPLLLQGGGIGVIELSGKKGGRSFDDRDLKFAGIIAEFSQTALTNAEKISLLEDNSIIDKDFGIYSYRFFADCLNRQIFTSARYRRPFSLAIFKIDNMAELRSRFTAGCIRKSIKKITKKVSAVIRYSDVYANMGDGEFYLLFPETDYFGSIMAAKRIEEGIAGIRYVSDGVSSSPIDLLLVSASFPKDGQDADALLNKLRKRAIDLRRNRFLNLDLLDKGYWESVEALMTSAKAPPSKEEYKDICSAAAPYVYTKYDKTLFNNIRDLFVAELISRPFLRGVLFLGVDTVSPSDDFCRRIGQADDALAVRVFVVGRRGDEVWNIPNITPVYLKDGEEPVSTVLFLNEEAGYAYFGKEEAGGPRAFHTSDLYTVEKMISKLRDHYLLQWL
ncbi:MAG: response regulator [bacterium]|nr:response regulator [bacterium]